MENESPRDSFRSIRRPAIPGLCGTPVRSGLSRGVIDWMKTGDGAMKTGGNKGPAQTRPRPSTAIGNRTTCASSDWVLGSRRIPWPAPGIAPSAIIKRLDEADLLHSTFFAPRAQRDVDARVGVEPGGHDGFVDHWMSAPDQKSCDGIQWTFDPDLTDVSQVGIKLRTADGRVPEQDLDHPDVHAAF